MREKIAEFLNWYGNANPYIDWHIQGNDEVSSSSLRTKNYRREQANEFLEAIRSEIEKVENPYPNFGEDCALRVGFEECRQKILSLLK
jgi:hypothetical protein